MHHDHIFSKYVFTDRLLSHELEMLALPFKMHGTSFSLTVRPLFSFK